MKIDLGNHYIEIVLDGKGSGKLTSDLKDEDAAAQGDDDAIEYNIAIDGLESLLLAQACAGARLDSIMHRTAIVDAVNGLQNHFF